MSDVDRLREAVDLLNNYADQREAEGGSWLWISQDRATAALLRALDVRQGNTRMVLNRWTGLAVQCCEVGRECDVHAAALALADTILGVPNTGGSESGDVPYKNPADEYPREDGWGYG